MREDMVRPESKMRTAPRPPRMELPREFPGAVWYGEDEVEAAARVIRSRSPFRYYGPDFQSEVFGLEREFGQFIVSKPGQPWPEQSDIHVTAVNSGTGALEAALDALGVGAGDEVLVQGFMWISSISAIVRSRAIPVLVDSDDTLNMDPDCIRAKVTPRTKVIMPVPMLGGCARIGAIMRTVREINAERRQAGLPPVKVLEDCAQVLGTHAHGAPGSEVMLAAEGIYRVGTFGDAGIFSLQINKNITAGEGGLVVTRDAALARRIDALHNAGYARDGVPPTNWYGDTPLGWGQGRRLTELQGAIARVQLKKLDQILDCMRQSHNRIEAHLQRMGLRTRGRADAQHPGDSGYYCLFELPAGGKSEAEKIAQGRAVADALREWGLNPWLMHDFEVHVYYNIDALVQKAPMNDGAPWNCPENAHHVEHSYHRGALPCLDELFITTVGINIPSQMTHEHEAHICAVLNYVLEPYLRP